MTVIFGRRYLFKKRVWSYLIWGIDTVGYVFFFLRRRPFPELVEKILVSRIGHMGDLLLASSVLPVLKKKFPHATIDFLAGRWAAEILTHNPQVRNVVCYNSFSLNRTGSLFFRIIEDIVSFTQAMKVLRRENYTLAIDLRAFPLNSLPLLFAGKIHYIIGYSTGGFGFLLDKRVEYLSGLHEIDHIADLVTCFGDDCKEEGLLQPEFFFSEEESCHVKELFRDIAFTSKKEFVIIHTGAGNSKKKWEKKRWQKLVAHLAAAAGTASVVIWCGINDVVQWQPIDPLVCLVKKDLTCTPCMKNNGCDQMDCMDISANEVMNVVCSVLQGAQQ